MLLIIRFMDVFHCIFVLFRGSKSSYECFISNHANYLAPFISYSLRSTSCCSHTVAGHSSTTKTIVTEYKELAVLLLMNSSSVNISSQLYYGDKTVLRLSKSVISLQLKLAFTHKL